ncbi:MAG: F0F1 ATP synthase subunit A [Gemmatimonadetes bacterium]|nr:F0F1 ATP synthase subunit A [Gemmatimonadota bacterium]
MPRLLARLAALLVFAVAATRPLTAQGAASPAAPAAERAPAAEPAHEGAAPQEGAHAAKEEHTDIITPHITDAHAIDVPTIFPPFVKEVELPRWAPVHVGSFEIDFSPTKHVVMLLLAALIVCTVLILVARSQARDHDQFGHAKGWAGGVEAMVLYLRNTVILPNVGPHGNAFVPFLLTLFFFILTANMLGLIPYGSTATGNISVTATLALITFVVVEVAGMRAQGMGYLNTIFFWPHDMSLGMRIPMFLIISPIEMVGKITRPFALAIRLFANMTAGHIVVLAFIGLIFFFKSYAIAGGPFVMAVAIMFLELFVAVLQAFVFTLLASVFIGQVRAAHH